MLTLAWILSTVTAFPLFYWAVECLAGLKRVAPVDDQGCTPPFAVLIPAHDEASGIGAAVASVRAQLRAEDRILVIADNCSDETAEIARAAGAEVVDRVDATRKGKAYALAKGRTVLRRSPPPVVIVLDADCVPETGALALLAGAAAHHGAAVQGRYLMQAASDDPLMVRVSSFAFLVKNSVRQRGLQRLSGFALLQGSGMAFPWRIFDTAALETASLVEDLDLGLDLALSGQSVRFEDRAGFVSAASTQAATVGQRTRWEHGALATAGRYLPRLMCKGLLGRPSLLVLAANLFVPPLSALIILSSIVLVLLGLHTFVTGASAPFAAVLTAMLTAAVALLAIWSKHGRALLPSARLPELAKYVAWKLPIHGRFLSRRQRDWVRTERA